MIVPGYYRSRQGRVFRVERAAEWLDPTTARYILRARPLRSSNVQAWLETSCLIQADALRDSIHRGQVIATPEQTFEQLWQQLRVDLESA